MHRAICGGCKVLDDECFLERGRSQASLDAADGQLDLLLDIGAQVLPCARDMLLSSHAEDLGR